MSALCLEIERSRTAPLHLSSLRWNLASVWCSAVDFYLCVVFTCCTGAAKNVWVYYAGNCSTHRQFHACRPSAVVLSGLLHVYSVVDLAC